MSEYLHEISPPRRACLSSTIEPFALLPAELLVRALMLGHCLLIFSAVEPEWVELSSGVVVDWLSSLSSLKV
jgi:hypothetical protein